jgi:hypothetical protein
MSPDSTFQTAPPILYKYRRFDSEGKHFRVITHGELWFACARDFNDPFDTSFQYNFDGLNTELGERWARDAANRYETHLNPLERERLAIARIEELRRSPEECRRLSQKIIELNHGTFGICSLCAARDNLLLWAHYSQDHKGFCVGLSVSYLDLVSRRLLRDKLLLDLHKVRYSSVVPNPNIFESMIKMEDTSHLVDFIATKSLDWSYEQEYRLVFWHKVNWAVRLDPEAISEVILGYRISDEDKHDILEACRAHIPLARLFQARKHESRFALSIEPIV